MGNRSVANVEDVFGARLREERQKRRWSQAELASRLANEGVELHWSAVAKMEARDAPKPRAIRLQEAVAVAKVLGLDLADLLEEPDASARALAAVHRAQEAQREAVQLREEALSALERLRNALEEAVAPARPDNVSVLLSRWHELQHTNGTDEHATAILEWMDQQFAAGMGKGLAHGKHQ